MKLFYIFLFISLFSSAEDKRPELPNFQVLGSKLDENLKKKKSAFTFYVRANDVHTTNTVIYSDNGIQEIAKVSEDGTFTIKTNPGNHLFQFVLTRDFYEITTDSIDVQAQYHTEVNLNFKSTTRQILVKKPVIYLYPTEKTDCHVSLDVKGDLYFTYPHYDNGWDLTANPSGDLFIDNKEYNYLFWESLLIPSFNAVDYSQGTIVSQKELLPFLEKSLTDFGLTSKEQADFLTYWIPQLKDQTNVYIYMMFNEACDEFAELNISPTPDNIARFYMLWAPVEAGLEDLELIPQLITPMNRKGFTVVEWGGLEIDFDIRLIEQI